jgi:hypothetical protein
MSPIEKLFAFIPFLEMDSEEEICTWGGGGLHASHNCSSLFPIYTKKFKDFIDAIYHAGLVDEDYSLNLSKLGLTKRHQTKIGSRVLKR